MCLIAQRLRYDILKNKKNWRQKTDPKNIGSAYYFNNLTSSNAWFEGVSLLSCFFMEKVVTDVTRCKMQQFLTGSWNFERLLFGYSLNIRSLLVHAAFYKVPN